jgi:hypothetical protein
MCIACAQHETESRPAAVAPFDLENFPTVDAEDLAALRRIARTGVDPDPADIRRVNRLFYDRDLATGELAACQCGTIYRPAEDGANLWRGRCITCESNFLESEIVRPLVERLGRRGARKALRRLARGE